MPEAFATFVAASNLDAGVDAEGAGCELAGKGPQEVGVVFADPRIALP